MAITHIPAPDNLTKRLRAETATENARRKAREAAQALIDSFPWEKTAEGVIFWRGVYNRLTAISDGEALKEN